MNDIMHIRRLVARTMVIYLWLHLPLVIGVSLVMGLDLELPALGVLLAAGVATLAWLRDRGGPVSRPTIAVALVMMPAVLLFLFQGRDWQMDMHMYFFAALAMLAAFCDWRVLIVGTGAIAVHHLLLNFLLPAAVFPNGADLARVVLHAVIVIVEAAALVWLATRLSKAFAAAAEALAQARASEAEMRRLNEEKEDAERAVEAERRNLQAGLADELDASVSNAVKAVCGEAERMRARTFEVGEMTRAGKASSAQAGARAHEASDEARGAATASEELAAAVAEIAERVKHSSEIAQQAVSSGGKHRRHGAEARRGGPEDRRGDRADLADRPADQSAGAQRHDRGGARGRRGQGIRRRRDRGQVAGDPDRARDPGNRRRDR